jgi:hypothetical protein
MQTTTLGPFTVSRLWLGTMLMGGVIDLYQVHAPDPDVPNRALRRGYTARTNGSCFLLNGAAVSCGASAPVPGLLQLPPSDSATGGSRAARCAAPDRPTR